LRKLKAEEPLEYFNPASTMSCTNATSLLWLLWRSSAGLVADMVLVGAAGQTTIADAVHLLVETTGSSSPVTAQTGDRGAFMIDSGKAQRLFDLAPMEVLEALRGTPRLRSFPSS
jgi:hypothetical protein